MMLLVGCASTPPPTGLMTRAQQQLTAAQKAQAADYAPVDLGFAKKRFQAAQAAMAAKKYDKATDMARESLADSRLAQTRAELAVLRNRIRKQNAENQRLRAQLLEPSTPSAPAQESSSRDNNNGLPSQITLPQPAPASSAPAVPASASTGGHA
ncbi:MAG TPA: DUF4398 domain-containing protein [Oleiagrimonas sp.]|nr:DUF4398 domain-containing protein [Oleiagrimonas sp.]